MTEKIIAQNSLLNSPDCILFGIGNSGRSDDGLGWAFLDALKERGIFKGQIHYRYQLQVEDSELISKAAQVIFVDAYEGGSLEGGFEWKKCIPDGEFAFTSHVLPPKAVLYLCQDLYPQTPPGWVLMVEGKDWELNVGMSPEAENNLQKALHFFEEKIKTAVPSSPAG